MQDAEPSTNDNAPANNEALKRTSEPTPLEENDFRVFEPSSKKQKTANREKSPNLNKLILELMAVNKPPDLSTSSTISPAVTSAAGVESRNERTDTTTLGKH